MTWVKICGVTHPDHIEAAVSGGADVIGVVCWPGSPRNVEPDEAAELVALAPLPVFLLTVDVASATTLGLAHRLGVSGIQPYGVEAPMAAIEATRAGLDVLMPIRPDKSGDIPNEHIPLIDSGTADKPGGTGRTLDWDHLDIPRDRWVLAGGLTPDNVADAVERTRPWGVDASSGLEVERGAKSPELITAFLDEVKRK